MCLRTGEISEGLYAQVSWQNYTPGSFGMRGGKSGGKPVLKELDYTMTMNTMLSQIHCLN